MKIKEYINKINKICDEYHQRDCKKCPLFDHDCGVPRENIDDTIEFVENLDLSKVCKTRCPHCGKEM